LWLRSFSICISCHLQQLFSFVLPIGYRLLYYLRVKKRENGEAANWHVYKDMCRSLQGELGASLTRDFEFCMDEDPDLFLWLLPEMYDAFPDQAMASAELLHRLMKNLDYVKLTQLVCSIMCGKVRMFKHQSLAKMVSESYKWEHFEQNCFWQLVQAHDLSTANYCTCLPLPGDVDCRYISYFSYSKGVTFAAT
jgi:integrator complex subunit 3